MLFKTESKVDNELALYEKRRKLEIDEKLSEYRRAEKNKAVDEIKAYADTEVINARKMFSDGHEAVKAFAVSKAERQTELALLDEKKAAKVAEITQVEKDFEARGLLRDRAIKAEKEKEAAIMAEKDKHIVFLEKSVETLSKQNEGILAKMAESLGKAADKESVTKVVGFGPSSEPKKV